jgi:hypothetical protein
MMKQKQKEPKTHLAGTSNVAKRHHQQTVEVQVKMKQTAAAKRAAKRTS